MANSGNILHQRRGRRNSSPKPAAKFTTDFNILTGFVAGRRGLSRSGRDSPATTWVDARMASSGSAAAGPHARSDRARSAIANHDRSITRQQPEPGPAGRYGGPESLLGLARWSRPDSNIIFSSINGWLFIAAFIFVLAVIFGAIDAQHIRPLMQMVPSP
jgi:hypothetical protein